MTTCGAMLSAVTVKTSVPAAKTPTAIISVARRMPAAPESTLSPRPEKTRSTMSRPALTPNRIEELRQRFEQRDEHGGPLASPEDAERAAHRLQRADVAQHDAGQEIRERRPDQGRDEGDEAEGQLRGVRDERRRWPSAAMPWAAPTGMATMIEAMTTRQNVDRDRARAARTPMGRPLTPAAQQGSRHHPALDAGDEDADAGEQAEQAHPAAERARTWLVRSPRSCCGRRPPRPATWRWRTRRPSRPRSPRCRTTPGASRRTPTTAGRSWPR